MMTVIIVHKTIDEVSVLTINLRSRKTSKNNTSIWIITNEREENVQSYVVFPLEHPFQPSWKEDSILLPWTLMIGELQIEKLHGSYNKNLTKYSFILPEQKLWLYWTVVDFFGPIVFIIISEDDRYWP